MNKKLLLFFVFVVVMIGCINDVDVFLGNGDNLVIGVRGGNMEILFLVFNFFNGSCVVFVEDFGVYEDGIVEEYKVSNVIFYLFDFFSKNLVIIINVI